MASPRFDLSDEVSAATRPRETGDGCGHADFERDHRPSDSDTAPQPQRTVDSPAHASIRLPPGGIVWADLEKSFIEQALVQTDGNQVRAAKLLGLSRDALRYRMEKYGIHPRRNGSDEARGEQCSR